MHVIVLIGDQRTGKTAISQRWVEDNFSEEYRETYINEFKIKSLDDNFRVKLWDTVGKQIIQKPDEQPPYRYAHGIIIVYDVTSQASFDNAHLWYQEIDRYAKEDVDVALIGNKTDLTRTVSYETAKSYAESKGIVYAEVSAKEGTNINHAFAEFEKQICARLGVLNPTKSARNFQESVQARLESANEPSAAPKSRNGSCTIY